MSVIRNDLLLTSDEGGYNLTKSLRFRSSASAYLSRTAATTTNRQIFTWSGWVKLGGINAVHSPLFQGYVSSTERTTLSYQYNVLYFTDTKAGVSTSVGTSAVYRDPSAWYHVVLSVDTTQATAANRTKIYINGVQQTLTGSYVAQNTNTYIDSNNLHYIGNDAGAAGRYFDGYLTEVNFIDGQALTPSSFGENNATTGVWQPKRYTGTYGTNGYYLPFTDVALTSGSNAGLGKDFSGNGNYWTTNNISVTSGATYDSMTDVPTLTSATAANYATLNPIHNPNGTNVTYSNANLNYSYSSGTANQMTVLSTIGITSGKFYWEFTEGSTINSFLGVNTGLVYGGGANGTYYASTGGGITGSSAATYSGTALTTATGNIVGFAFDANALTLAVYKNNTLQGTFSSLESGKTWFPTIAPYTGSSGGNGAINFGQRPFSYTPPTGYVALNTYNLPDSTIVAGNANMDVTTYTGNATARSIVNSAGMSPDFVWIKNRTNAYGHRLFDSIRGAGVQLLSNTTNAESTDAAGMTAFNSNGFSLGIDNIGYAVNENNSAFVAWQWRASDSAPVSNTSGSITSTVSVNASAGFSIVTCTSPASAGSFTFGHGLGVAPKFIISKSRSGTGNWSNYHASTGAGGYLLFTTAAYTANTDTWNNTTPTSTVVSSTTNWWGTSSNLVFYCWSEIAGFSKFGSYVGNGSTDGTFCYTGFRPKFVMVKRTDAANSWAMIDTSRNSENTASRYLLAESSSAENSDNAFDVLSNGFKCRLSGALTNASGGNYIYMAFASNPFKNSLAR